MLVEVRKAGRLEGTCLQAGAHTVGVLWGHRVLLPQEGGTRLWWQGWSGGSGGRRLFKVHGGGGHGLHWRSSWVALLLFFDGWPVCRHLVEAGGLGFVAALHKDVEAGEGSRRSGRDLAPTQVQLGVVWGHEVRAVAVTLVTEGLARVG